MQSVVRNGNTIKRGRCVFLLTIVLLTVILFGGCAKSIKEEKNGTEEVTGEIYFSVPKAEHIVFYDENSGYIDNEILLVASDGVAYSQIEELASQYDAEIVGWIEATGDYQIRLSGVYSEEEIISLASIIEDSELVLSASADLAFIAEDNAAKEHAGILYGNMWQNDLKNYNDFKGKSWGIEAIEAVAAWEILERNSNSVHPVRVGIIDSGFDGDHEDLGFAELFYNTQVSNHGTHVAGTIGAKANNKVGICGVYPYGDGNLYGVSYAGICEYTENGHPIYSSMFLKIAYAELILRNVRVINSSLGSNYYKWSPPLGNSGSQWDERVSFMEKNAHILADFLNRLIQGGHDFLLVTAAGNDSSRGNGIIYDSKYNFWTTVIDRKDYPDVYDRILVVGAVDDNLKICDYSNGGDRVDLYAPGGSAGGRGIYSTLPKNKYSDALDGNLIIGTSMATPHVSGVAAMVWALNSDLTGKQVKSILCINAKTLDSGDKMVNARLALEVAEQTIGTGIEVSKNGVISCWVVDKDNENTKIENATVEVCNIETEQTYSTMTDIYGHFELIVPEGKYELSVKADGYLDYKWPDTNSGFINPIIVSNENVNYLEDWIKLSRDKVLARRIVNLTRRGMGASMINSHEVIYTYDEKGRVVKQDGCFGEYMVSVFEYNDLNQVISRYDYPFGWMDICYKYDYVYDEQGCLLACNADIDGYQTSHTYDFRYENGKLQSFNSEGAFGSAIFDYDEKGNCIRYQVDNTSPMVYCSYPEGVSGVEPIIGYYGDYAQTYSYNAIHVYAESATEYDSNGNLTCVISRTFDEQRKVLSEEFVYSEWTQQIRYDYDDEGYLIKEEHSSNSEYQDEYEVLYEYAPLSETIENKNS